MAFDIWIGDTPLKNTVSTSRSSIARVYLRTIVNLPVWSISCKGLGVPWLADTVGGAFLPDDEIPAHPQHADLPQLANNNKVPSNDPWLGEKDARALIIFLTASITL